MQNDRMDGPNPKLAAAATGPAEPGPFFELQLRWNDASELTKRILIGLLALCIALVAGAGYWAFRSTSQVHQIAGAAAVVDHQHARVVSVLEQGNLDTAACEGARDPYTCGKRVNAAIAKNLLNIRYDITRLSLPARADLGHRAVAGAILALARSFDAINTVRTTSDAANLQADIDAGVKEMDRAFQQLADALAS